MKIRNNSSIGCPEQLLEGMAEYFVLSAQNKSTQIDNSSQKCSWQLISKAIFNPQAPQHKIFKENISKLLNMNILANNSSQTNTQNSIEQEGNSKRKQRYRQISFDTKMNNYINKVNSKLTQLEQLRSTLDIYKQRSNQFDIMRKVQSSKCHSLKEQEDTISEEKVLQEQKLKEKQLVIKAKFDKLHSHTTRAFETKKQLTQEQFKLLQTKQSEEKSNTSIVMKKLIKNKIHKKLIIRNNYESRIVDQNYSSLEFNNEKDENKENIPTSFEKRVFQKHQVINKHQSTNTLIRKIE